MRCSVLICLVGLSTVVVSAAEPGVRASYLEAGVAYVGLEGDANRRAGAGATFLRKDDAAPGTLLAAGRTCSDWLGIRASYLFVEGMDATTRRPLTGTPGNYTLTDELSADLHLLAIGPELKYRLNESFAVSAYPAANWLHVRETTRHFTDAPMVTIVPRSSRTDEEFSFGGSVAAIWHWAERWAATFRYTYVDLDPSWVRRGHVLSAGVAWNF